MVQNLNEAAGRKYYMLVGWLPSKKRWEAVFGDHDKETVEYEKDDQQQSRGMPDFEYKNLRILTLANAKSGTVNAAVAALSPPKGKNKDESVASVLARLTETRAKKQRGSVILRQEDFADKSIWDSILDTFEIPTPSKENNWREIDQVEIFASKVEYE